jgi:signal peptidase II
MSNTPNTPADAKSAAAETPAGKPALPPAALRWGIFIVAFLIGVALDIGSKEVAFHYLPEPRDTHVVWSWFSWTHARNLGAAFSMFEGQQGLFMAMTILAFVGLPYFVHAAEEKVLRTSLIMGLVLAGVAGNFWDRMVFGYVRDFIDVHAAAGTWLYDFTRDTFGTHIWPTFNVADMFITGGCVAVFVFLGAKPEEEEESTGDAAQTSEGADAAPAA